MKTRPVIRDSKPVTYGRGQIRCRSETESRRLIWKSGAGLSGDDGFSSPDRSRGRIRIRKSGRKRRETNYERSQLDRYRASNGNRFRSFSKGRRQARPTDRRRQSRVL